MRSKPMKASLHNILFGCIVILGLAFDPTAFHINHHHGVLPRKCSKFTTTSTRIATGRSQSRNIISMTMDRNEDHLSSKLLACERSTDNWDMNMYAGATSRQTILSSLERFPRIAMALLFAFGKFLSLSGAKIAPSTKSFVAWRFQQIASIGGTFVLLRLLAVYSGSISSWYMELLTRSPLLTKTMTTATIGLLGDTTAQYLETRMEEKQSSKVKGENNTNNEKETFVSTSSIGFPLSMFRNYDRRRGLSCFGENLLISGPLMHFAYNAMEEFVPTSNGGRSAFFAACTHALLDNFILDTFFVAVMFVTTGIAEGYIREIKTQFREDFFPTLRTGWLAGICLLPVQVMMFRFFPLSLRVLGVNIIDIFWEAYISHMVHRRRRHAHD